MQIIRVNSWNELQEALYADSFDNNIGRFRSAFAFRGLSSAEYDLKTSLIRLGGDYASLEHHILRNFRKYAHRDVFERDSVWHWLSTAQHHGLPTRLLDWTYSPFVAMHFATDDINKFNVDAAIWMVDYVKAHEALPEPLKSKFKEEGSEIFTVDLLTSSFEKQEVFVTPTIKTVSSYHVETRSLKTFDSLSPSPFLLFFEPPSIDDRIVNQFAIFSVISDPSVQLQVWLEQYPKIYRKIIIPSELKWEIRDKLDQANITERVLFPGLDGLAKWLKRHYSPNTQFEATHKTGVA